MAHILIIDDDDGICHVLTRVAQRMGHTARAARSLAEGEALLSREPFDVVLLDVGLPDGNGLAAIPRVAARPSRPEVVVITGAGDPEGAEAAIGAGAWDYIEKDSSTRRMAQILEQVVRYREGRAASAPPKGAAATVREGIIGDSPRLSAALEAMARCAGSDASVLITGETGTGKELFAQAVHANSPRATGPFVIVDCGSLPDNLVESILFGHVRGAFTGADRDREGLFRAANGGTLFLDEVGELPLHVQSAFLRVLQQRTFRRVGGTREERSDFRLVAATNRDLDRMVEAGAFRNDLLFRLRATHLALPPLRERTGDIPPLAAHYMAEFCSQLGVARKRIAPDFLDMLAAYDWPGNVRELVNAVEHAVNAAVHEPLLFQAHLPRELRARVRAKSLRASSLRANGDAPAPTVPPIGAPMDGAASDASQPPLSPAAPSPIAPGPIAPGPVGPGPDTSGPDIPGQKPNAPAAVATELRAVPPVPATLPLLTEYREQVLAQAERRYLEQAMLLTGNDVRETCRISGLSQSRLYHLLKKHGVPTPGWKR
ncbi:MAG: sigma-54 dependent transcriptional regulator [Desulfovibrio sp.]|jgi:two-component system NtrC family response regulator|nr:sigma-54 dependent transcriptional regulator [Desulfovibrio sp.]